MSQLTEQEFAIATEGNLQANVQITQWSTESKKKKYDNKEKVPVKITVKKKKDTVLADL